jgi:hypothetical protein
MSAITWRRRLYDIFIPFLKVNTSSSAPLCFGVIARGEVSLPVKRVFAVDENPEAIIASELSK